jgi:hypothetical protein
MIRIAVLIICIFMLVTVVTAEETTATNNSTTSKVSNITNSTNTSQQVSLENSAMTGTDSTPTPTPKPVYKESVGSVYESDYTEPQPMTFISYPTCS